AYNPGWHMTLDLRNLALIAQCVAMSALERTESRGGHTREDFPQMSPEWRAVNLVCSLDGAAVRLTRQSMVPMRQDLLTLFDRDELAKYLTEGELAGVGEEPAPSGEPIGQPARQDGTAAAGVAAGSSAAGVGDVAG